MDSLKSMVRNVVLYSYFSNSDHGGDVFDGNRNIVEALDGFFDLACDVILLLPVLVDVLNLFTIFLLLHVLDHIYPLGLQDVAYHDAVVQLLHIAAEGCWRQATVFGEGLDEVLEVEAVGHVVIADDDEGVPLLQKLFDHGLHERLSIAPRKVVVGEVWRVLLDHGVEVFAFLEVRLVDRDVKVGGLG